MLVSPELVQTVFQVGQGYPHDPPKVKCETMVYHPNIDLEGNVCLNILRSEYFYVFFLHLVMGRVLCRLTVSSAAPQRGLETSVDNKLHHLWSTVSISSESYTH